MNHPSFKQALLFWLKLGFISFGGPAGQIGIMHEYIVEKKKWLSGDKFTHALNYCMILPGPEAQQLATYTGWLLHGTKGGLAAGILFFLPSMFILAGLCIIYVLFGEIPTVKAVFYVLKPAVVAIVIMALIKIAKKSLSGLVHYIIAALAFVAIYFLDVPFPLIVLSALIIGFVITFYFKKENETPKTDTTNSATFSWKTEVYSILKKLSIFIILWIIPFVVFSVITGNPFWKNLIVFFTKAAFVTFGGAYAVLPYAAQVSVEKFNWLSEKEMIDGLALGETTPGPLIMVLTFVGFMGGYNVIGSLTTGLTALVVTTYYTFLPCFLFIFAGAPLIERTHHDKRIKSILSFVTAAVVGVVLNLTVFFGRAVLFNAGPVSLDHIDLFSLAWIIISFVVLYFTKFGMIRWIVVSAVAGIVWYLINVQ